MHRGPAEVPRVGRGDISHPGQECLRGEHPGVSIVTQELSRLPQHATLVTCA